MDQHSSGVSPGERGDPVADAIRAEQNAAAAPSPGEGERAVECKSCETESEDVEPRSLLIADCSALQTPDKPWRALCDDCSDERPSLREKQLEKARKRLDVDYHDDPVAVAFYGCGRAEIITEPESEEPMPPGMQESASAPIRCACEAPLSDIELLDKDAA